MKVGNLTWPYLGAPTAGPLLAASPPFVRQPLAQEKKPNIRMKREPREMGVVAGVVAFLLAAALAIAPAAAQVTGILGSPSATTTINGKQLPPPPSKFGGVIKESAKDSKPWWPPRVVPPKGAPNILLILTDDGAAAGAVTGKFAKHRIECGIAEKMDAALPPGSGGVIAVYDTEGADAVDKTLPNSVKKSVAHIDGTSAKKLKAGLAEAQAGMGG